MSRLPVRLLTLGLAGVRGLVRRGQAPVVRRILVAHYLLLGDTILLAPLLAKLAARYPDADKIVLARPAVAPLFSGKPYGFTALAYDPRDSGTFFRLLAQGPFDLAYVLGDNRYAWLARALGARWIIGFGGDRPAWKNWMLDVRAPFPSAPAAWADMVAGLLPGPAPAPFGPGDWPAPEAPAVAKPAGSYAVLHVGASTPLKLWPADRWRALAEWLRERGIDPVWSAGRNEAALVEEIDPERRYPRYCDTLSLPQLWHLLAGANLLVCPDTGVAHLGKVAGVPTLALFGPGCPTIYGKGDFWRNARYIAAAETPFPCRDQRLLFRRELPWVRRCGRAPAACATASAALPGAPHAAPCMHALGFAAVQAACRELLPRRLRPASQA